MCLSLSLAEFGLFLKGIGLSLDDALLYFRRIFSRKSGVNFDKAYAYNIRHNYGKEGKRADYTPFSCAKIINGDAPTQGDHHGGSSGHVSGWEGLWYVYVQAVRFGIMMSGTSTSV